MRLTFTFALLLLAAPAAASQTGGWTYTDDFESGVLDPAHWTRGGRDLPGTGVVDVVSRSGSLVGHVYHSSFTEATLTQTFEVGPSFDLEFDMEVRAVDPNSPGWNYNSFAGVWIELSGPGEYGRLEVIYCTSGYRQAVYNPDPKVEVLQLVPNMVQHHQYSLQDIYALLPGVNPSLVTSVSLSFWSYCSWWNSAANGDVWFDNVHVSGLPAALGVTPVQPVAGAYATFKAIGMSQGAWAYLAVSRLGPGSTPAPPLGLDLDIAQAFQAAPRTRVAVGGSAVWTLLVPAAASGQSAWFQAAEIGRSTRVLGVTIL